MRSRIVVATLLLMVVPLVLAGESIELEGRTGGDSLPRDVRRLLDASEGNARIILDPETHLLTFAGLPADNFARRENEALDPVSRALKFLERFGGAFGVQDPPSQLVLTDSASYPALTRVEFGQRHLGVPVRRHGLRIWLDRDLRVVVVDGRIRPNLELETTPTLSANVATTLAIDHVAGNSSKSGLASEAAVATGVELVVHTPPGIDPLLTYEVEVQVAPDAAEIVHVDAHGGSVVSQAHASLGLPTVQLESGSLDVGGSSQTVNLFHSYQSPVVVAAVRIVNNTIPVVVRIGNVTPSSFDVRLQNPSGSPTQVDRVTYLVVEEGTWTVDGHVLEAHRYSSTVTDRKNAWVGQTQAYNHTFASPVVIGQVMSDNDPAWSVFWDYGAARDDPPSPTTLNTGKMVGEDSNTTRSDETVGFVVFEAAHGVLGGVEFEAAVGPDTVLGYDNGPPFNYAFAAPFPTPPALVLSSVAGMDGGDGAWANVFGIPTTTVLPLGVDEDQIGDADRGHTNEQIGYVAFASAFSYPPPLPCVDDSDCTDADFCNGVETCDTSTGFCDAGSDPCAGQVCDEFGDQCVPEATPQFETVVVPVVNAAASTVNLQNVYNDPIVVCTPRLANNASPAVTRVSAVAPTSFDLRLQNPSGDPLVDDEVHCLVVESGVWEVQGQRFEARSYLSTLTDRASSWAGESQSYGQAYVAPVVLGQVMSGGDPRWSTFWSRGNALANPPSGTSLYAGKTVGEDPDFMRVPEIVGYVVFEAASGTLAGVPFEAALGADTVRGQDDGPPFQYTFGTPFAAAPAFAVASMSGVDGVNGGWANLSGAVFSTPSTLSLVIDEDQAGDAERLHTTEQVGYLVFESDAVFRSTLVSVLPAADVVEGQQATFEIRLGSALLNDATLAVDVSDGTASGGIAEPADFDNAALEYFDGATTLSIANGSVVTIPAGTTTVEVRVQTLDDPVLPLAEGPETFSVAAQSAGDPQVVLHPTQAIATGVIDDFEAVNFVRTSQFGGAAFVEGRGVAADGAGGVALVGAFQGTADFDPGPGSAPLTASSGSAFVVRLDAAGSLMWAGQFEGDFFAEATAVFIDGSGNVHLAGSFSGTVDFDPGPGVVQIAASGPASAFVAKLDAAGALVWARRLGGPGFCWSAGMGVDAGGNVLVAGGFDGTADFDPGPATFNIAAAGETDAFVSKLDVAGDLVWAEAFGGASTDEALSLSLDPAGDVYIAGRFRETADFDPGPGNVTLVSAGETDAFVVRLAANGTLAWARRLGGASSVEAFGLDAGGTAVYTVGRFEGTADFDPGTGDASIAAAGAADAFVSKLDTAGSFVWVRPLGGAAFDDARAVAVAPTGEIHTAGHVDGVADFDPGTATFALIPSGETDVFLSKLTANGEFVSAGLQGGASYDLVSDIAVDATGLHLAGSFADAADFDPGPAAFPLVPFGPLDACLTRFAHPVPE